MEALVKTALTTAAAAAGLALTLGLTACGGSSSAAKGPAGGSTPPTSPSMAGDPSSSGSSNGSDTSSGSGTVSSSFDVCQSLPLATVNQITGVTFTKTKTSSVDGLVFECSYSDAGSDLLQVSVETSNGMQSLTEQMSVLKQVGHPADKVSGVGDAAFSEPDPNGNAGSVGAAAVASYGAAFGDVYIHIGGLTYVNPAQGKQIVELLHAKL
jgi:hypothetical protein